MKDGLKHGHVSFKNFEMIKIANAPCSWGALEFDLEEKSEEIGFQQVLDELSDTGYVGTELGDWGFMPTDPPALKKELGVRNLELLGAFVPVALSNVKNHDKGIVDTLKVARLMFESGFKNALIVLADDNGAVEERTKNAGRIKSEMSLTDKEWNIYVEGVERIAKQVRDNYGLRTVFHHHCGGFIETPDEIKKLLELTDPELVGLCLDMGHYAFGGGDPVEALNTHFNRIWHVHFKDFSPKIANESREVNGDYFDAIKRGVFCELGKGSVDFKSIIQLLKDLNYQDWIVVEQDILPGMGDPKNSAEANRDYLKGLGL